MGTYKAHGKHTGHNNKNRGRTKVRKKLAQTFSNHGDHFDECYLVMYPTDPNNYCTCYDWWD